jgi:biotin transport system substrate-specific component
LNSSATFIDILRPARVQSDVAYNAITMLLATALLAISAQMALAIPFSPVPVTGQTFIVLLIGAVFGPVRGGAVILMYLAEGFSGLPVFANGGFGPTYLVGPTGGYLISFVPAAVIVGYLAERGWDRRLVTTFAAMALGTAIILLGGTSWLSLTTQRSDILAIALYPFLPGAIIKIAAAAFLLPAVWKFVNR